MLFPIVMTCLMAPYVMPFKNNAVLKSMLKQQGKALSDMNKMLGTKQTTKGDKDGY